MRLRFWVYAAGAGTCAWFILFAPPDARLWAFLGSVFGFLASDVLTEVDRVIVAWVERRRNAGAPETGTPIAEEVEIRNL